jgi:S-DNA-T family DNA segregation ATPase FtsK/SpoIIIE
MNMKKEISATLLFFLVILTLVSLLSYHSGDPSLNHVGSRGEVHNLFGQLGAQLSGLLVGLFGLGSFWIPLLLLLASVHLLGKQKKKGLVFIGSGGFLLIISTSVLLSFASVDNMYILFGAKFTSGGMTGIPLKNFFLKYANLTGGTFIALVIFIIGLIMATGFSFVLTGKKIMALFISLKELLKKIKQNRENKKYKKVDPEKSKKNLINPDLIEIKKKRTKEIKIKPISPKPVKSVPVPRQGLFDFMQSDESYKLPSPSFLADPEPRQNSVDDENLRMRSMLLEKKLEDFGVKGKITAISPGPVITTFEYQPAPGVKISKIVSLTDDLALALRAMSIRMVAPIPGKAAIGIEIPNDIRESVRFKEIVTSSAFINSKSTLAVCLGNDIVGEPVAAELDKMPHLLIAGATGAGKSVGLNVIISSILFNATPEQVRLIMIDPKRIELSVYDGIPHLITPVVTDMKKATNALFWAVREMERRYELLATLKTRNITSYNKKVTKLLEEKDNPQNKIPDNETEDEASVDDGPVHELLPYIVIIIDELADLMMVSSKDVEVALARLAQMARAAGLHIILATQRPSVDVLTGMIKANFPTRISFQVSSKTDSRTIIDSNGAESLLGMGDMLYLPPGTAKLMRIHGAYISDEELNELIIFWKNQKQPEYDTSILEAPPETNDNEANGLSKDDYDEKYDEAVALITRTKQASISSVQRHLRIGYNRAARIIETMEKEGIIGPADGSKPREILVGSYDELP